MRTCLVLGLLSIALAATPALAQQNLRQGSIKSIDLDKRTLVLIVDKKELSFALSEDAQFFDGAMGAIAKDKRKAAFVAGAAVTFRTVRRDGKEVVNGLRLNRLLNLDTSKLVSLPELGANKYQGHEGGLYPGGKNERPKAHEAAGLALARTVRPLDAKGKPSEEGKIVLLSVGMSNASQVFTAFKRQADADKKKSPHVVVVNGAQGGMTAARIQDPDDEDTGTKYWTTVDRMLSAAKVTPAQVQVVWIKQADAGPRSGFPTYAKTLQKELARIVQVIAKRYPNVKLVYLSCRTYGGYATTGLNPDPYAYESGFSVKWLIEQQLKGDKALNFDAKKGKVMAPWLSWGPYLWANGKKKNADGLSYDPDDFGRDGTHPSPKGQRKVGEVLLRFFKSDSTTKGWFVAKE